MSITVFLSTVSDEFRSYRDLLVHDLTRHNVAVKVQEDFKDLGGDTLDKLDTYIADCDAVVHLVGDMCGAAAGDRQQQALLAKHSDLKQKLPSLGEALTNGVCLSYTQWEAWLALYHGKPLMIAKAAATAPRGPKFAPNDASRAAQAGHLERLTAFHRYPGSEFASSDELAKQIAYTAIIDLLAEDKAKKAVQARVSTQDEILAEILKKVSEDKSVPLDTLRAILSSMGEAAASYNAAEIEQKLAAKATEFRELTDRLNRLSNADPVVAQLRAEASTALASGSFERADQLLAEAETRDLSGLEDIEALARQKRLSAADSRAQRAAVALLRLNPDAYGQAAAHYGEASRIAAVADALKAREYLSLQAKALVRLGDEFGDNAALRAAIELLTVMLGTGDRAVDPLEWAATQNNLGIALQTLGAREAGAARLEQAVAAYLAALEERTRERVPLQWAETQNNLGNALQGLGGRASGAQHLNQAAAAYRAALEEQTRDRAPLLWAATQHNLGNVLRILGQRESGTARLKEAIAAHRSSLKEWTRERDPLQWAATLAGLGGVLTILGSREGGTEKLEEAVEAYRAALEEYTRERVPLGWAATQASLGNALKALGDRESGTARLEQAVAAYHAALQEQTRERAPLQWAVTQNDLGNALRRIGERESGTRRLEQAVEAYQAALQELARSRVPLLWARAHMNLGTALSDLGERDAGVDWLKQAVEAFRAALQELTRERVPLEWAMTQNNLGNAFRKIGERERRTGTLEEAVEAYRAALQEYTRQRTPLEWVTTLGNQGIAMMLISEHTKDDALATTALQQIQTAVETLRSDGQQHWAAVYESQLPNAQAVRDRLKGQMRAGREADPTPLGSRNGAPVGD